jgi:NAD(P)-dependent dehydrogenase (short-subunit alcohol dehydrogenase family)
VAGEQVILVTGCSSGIGRAIALEAVRRGHRVFATARTRAAVADLEKPEKVVALTLDVTDPESIRSAVENVLARAGRIDALVNNAGYGQYGSVEDVSAEEWRAQFDVNFFGAIEMTRAALPAMRAQKTGTVVMVSSVAGKLAVPFAAPYSATKHALEAVADALRVELSAFGIRVVLVEPGPIETGFRERARSQVAPLLGRPGPYRELYAGAEGAMDGDFSKGGGTSEDVARTVLNAIESSRPRARYAVTRMAKLLIPITRLLPDRWIDAMLRKSLKVPSRP